ncbi:type VII secretion protein EccB [Nocardioides sp.]|uniref:type VII secretion protein EccB n=1 Tax=Nocardioides sp. TaxID=35761 RepID=UPI003527C0CA
MATKRDLVEAHAFSRRRLVTAFVSGAPGGREVEPARPGRALVGGLALSVLLVAGALIAGIFSPRVAADWQDPGLVVSKEKGAAYVITEAGDPVVLHPVVNNTSALLIAGDAAREPKLVPQQVIDEQVVGGDLGIVGAPSTVPSAALLLASGWTACTSDGTGVRLTIAARPEVTPEPRGALVVRDAVSGSLYLIAQAAATDAGPSSARSYALPGQGAARDKMLSTLGLPVGAEATEVSPQWLALVPPGGPLTWDSAKVPDAGARVDYEGDVYDGARVGDLVQAPGQDFVLLAGGPAPIDPFAAAVYANLPPPHTPRVRSMSTLPNHRYLVPPFGAARWPEGAVEPVAGESCVQLTAAADTPPVASLVGEPGAAASSVAVPAGRRAVSVDPGRGALVESGDWTRTASETRFLVDGKGTAYPLEGSDTSALLGYADYAPPLVPDTWLALLERGVVLSQEAALCPPDPTGGSTCE